MEPEDSSASRRAVMTSLKSRPFSSWAALLAGTLSITEGLLILSNPEYYGFDSASDYLVMAAEGAALLVLPAALAGLHARLTNAYGRLGKAGFLAAVIGTVVAGAGHLIAVPFFDFVNVGGMVYVLVALKEGFFLAGGMAYASGVVLMSAGFLLLGVAILKAGVVPRWSGPAVVVGLAGLWSANALGWIVFGLAWMLLGYALWSGRVAAAEQTPSSG